jgi:hypothetical protein
LILFEKGRKGLRFYRVFEVVHGLLCQLVVFSEGEWGERRFLH